MGTPIQSEHETYRVIVLSSDGKDILSVPDRDRFALPSVEIPRWQRVAENLTEAVRTDWGEEIVCLFEQAELPGTHSTGTHYHVAEHWRTVGVPKMPTKWVPVATLSNHALSGASDYLAIQHSKDQSRADGSVGPFARPGWFQELRAWVEGVIEPLGFHLKGSFRQLNASPSFSLIRFETDGPPLWFKAVGEPNQREFPITRVLSRLFPGYVPSVLGTLPEWDGWLTREVRGKLLSDVLDQLLWERAAAAFARLQIQSIGHGSQILGAGARDLGSAVLSKLVQPFMSVIAQLMERQTKIPPAVLDREDLLLLTDSLQKGIEALEATGIPETVGHLDLNPGNIILSENRCAFLDWAEAYVGNPLFSLQYLLLYTRRALGAYTAVETSLTQAYCAQWEGVVSPAAITDALAFAPLLAVFSYAAGNDLWKQPPELEDPTVAGYLRSLARRMHREAKELADRRLLCLQ